MAQTRKFSIYLLKRGFGASRALKPDHSLTEVSASKLKTDWSMFVSDAKAKQPWWRDYFGVGQNLNQSVQGGLVFLKAGGRGFALSFGTGHHALKDECYEHDFGLRVTLNSVDPELIRNTDVLDPGTARRQRTQVASLSDLTLFDFDGNRSILRTLTGSSREEYRHLTKHVTGGGNLKIGSNRSLSDIPPLLVELLKVYEKDTYKTAFPDLQNVVPVKDPDRVAVLNVALRDAVRSKDERLVLTVPSIINHNDNYYISYSGAGASQLYEDAEMADYYKYLAQQGIDVGALSVDTLRHHDLRVVDENGQQRERFSIYRSLIFETTLSGDDGSFHLSEGQWYRVEQDFIKELREFLDSRYEPSWLPNCKVRVEGEYNEIAIAARPGAVNLDQTNIAPKGQSQIEPCDIYSTLGDEAVLTHVKIGTDSSVLSHLFNQGVNSVKVLRLLEPARDKLSELVIRKGDSSSDATPIPKRAFRVNIRSSAQRTPIVNRITYPSFLASVSGEYLMNTN